MEEKSLSEIVPADAVELAPLKRRLPNDRNPLLLYLGRLTGETSAKTMARVLRRAGKIIATWMVGAADVPYDQLPWHMLRYQHVARLRSVWAQAGLKPRTINQYLSAVKGVMDEAENLGLISPDDARRVEKVKGLKVRDEILAGRSIDDDEVRRLVSQCDTSTMGLRNYALLALLFGGGLRRREVSKVRIADFDAGPVRMRDFVSPEIPPPAFDSHDIAGLAGVDLFGERGHELPGELDASRLVGPHEPWRDAMKMTTEEAFVKVLQRHGIEHAFGIIGSAFRSSTTRPTLFTGMRAKA